MNCTPANSTRTAGATAPAKAPVGRQRRTHRIVTQPVMGSADPADPSDQAGQTTAEYALLTGAIALLVAAVTAWATSTGKIGRLLDAVFNYLTRAIS